MAALLSRALSGRDAIRHSRDSSGLLVEIGDRGRIGGPRQVLAEFPQVVHAPRGPDLLPRSQCCQRRRASLFQVRRPPAARRPGPSWRRSHCARTSSRRSPPRSGSRTRQRPRPGRDHAGSARTRQPAPTHRSTGSTPDHHQACAVRISAPLRPAPDHSPWHHRAAPARAPPSCGNAPSKSPWLSRPCLSAPRGPSWPPPRTGR